MYKHFLIEVVALPIILLFLYTGLDKLDHFQNFRLQLHISPWHLLSSLSGVVAWTLPVLEIIVSVMLIWPQFRKTGFAVSTMLFVVFIAYISILLGSGKKLPCSCGGIISYLSWKTHLILNTVFLLLSLLGIYLEKKRRTFFGQR